jgi:hypothetical protein
VIRWIVAPLAGLLLFGGSAFLDALEQTTEESLALAEASEEAPVTTAEAAGEVETLPAVAQLTKEQAAAFRALAEALQVSADRIAGFNDTLAGQAEGLEALAAAMARVDGSVRCIRTRLDALLDASEATPPALAAVSDPLVGITSAQNKSIRHLKSINRKLTALGVVAVASGVEAPPPPEDAPAPEPGAAPEAVDC